MTGTSLKIRVSYRLFTCNTNHSKGSTSNGTEDLCKDIWNDEFEIKVSAYLAFQIGAMVFDWQVNRIWKLSWKQIQK